MANSHYHQTITIFLSLLLLLSPLVNCQKTLLVSSKDTCPIDTLKLGVCANLLDWLVHIKIGKPPTEPCCSLVKGLVDLEAAACLCTALKASVLGIVTVDLDLALTLLVNVCGKDVPSGFKCA